MGEGQATGTTEVLEEAVVGEAERGLEPGQGREPSGRLAWRSDPPWTRCRGSDGGTVPAAPVTSPCHATQVQPDVDNLEADSGGAQQWGRLLLSLAYDFRSQEVRDPLADLGRGAGWVKGGCWVEWSRMLTGEGPLAEPTPGS